MSDNYTIIQLYNVDQISELLGVSRSTVYRLTESRVLSSYKVRGCVRVSHEDVMNYLEKNRMSSGI